MKIRTLVTSLALAGAVMSMPLAQAQKSFSPKQVKDIESIVENYLIQNPEVLVKASQTLQAREQKRVQAQAMQGIESSKTALFNNKENPTAGNPNGSVLLVEFFDYQCGHCKEMAPIVESLIKKDKNLKVIYKELPIFGGASRFAAQAALASMKQNKYLPFHNALFANKGPLSPKIVLNIASKAGINVKQLEKDMKSKSIQTQLRDNFRLAQAIKLVGTPTFVLSNKKQTKFEFIPGSTSQEMMQKKLDSLE